MARTPIADLSYRGYDGPLLPPVRRWWTIAKLGIRGALKKRSLYTLTLFCAWYYLLLGLGLFVFQQLAEQSPQGQQAVDATIRRLVWKDQFLHGFSYAQLPMLLITLLLGAGAIANDNRSRALLVILAKPVTKGDYLLGKWVGIFLPLFTILLIPTVLFYAYGGLTYANYGFLSDDLWILPKMVLVCALAAAFHASMILGVSSLFDQGRLAGATYAALYFISNFFTVMMEGIYRSSGGEAPAIIRTLFYASLDGMLIGACKAILGTSGTPPFAQADPNSVLPIPAPNTAAILLILFGLMAGALALAYRRIRAVEVVG